MGHSIPSTYLFPYPLKALKIHACPFFLECHLPHHPHFGSKYSNSLCCTSIDKPPMTFLPWGFFIVTLLQVGETSHLIYTSLEMMQKKPFGWFSNQYKSSNIQRYRKGKNRSKTLKHYSTRKKFLLFSVCIVLEQRITRKIEQNLGLPLNLPYPNHLYTYVKCIQL